MCANCSPGSPSRGLKNASYKVLVGSKTPAVLVELGFLSNQYEASRLARKDYQLRLARAIAEGVIEALKQAR
jgi:N-acetylmuramoyl-L-alanine amidase